MRQILTGVVTLILGFFTLVFAAVMGLFISIGALIAKPFLVRKLRKMQEQQAAQFEQAYGEQREFGDAQTFGRNEGFSQTKETPFGPKTRHQGQTIDGDYQDITDHR